VSQNKAWKGRTGGGSFGQKSLFLYFKYGSIPLAYAITAVVVVFYIVFHAKATRSIYLYFRKRHTYPMGKALFCTYRNHYIFGKTLIDKFAVFAGRGTQYKIEIEGKEIFDEIINNSNKGAIIVNSHVGNAEIAGYLLGQDKKRMTALIFGGEAANMQSYRNQVMQKNNIRLIPVVDAFSHFIGLYQAASEHDLISVIGDRTYPGSKNTTAKFLGADAFFPLNPFQIASKLKLPALAFYVMRSGYKKYKIHVVRLDHDSELNNTNTTEYLQKKYIASLEETMRKYPLQWFNYYNFWLDNPVQIN